MPVYEYQCNDCTKRFELFVPQHAMSEVVVCRHCHSPKIRKLVSSFASVGGGEYQASGDMGSSACGGCSGGSCGNCGRH